MDGLAKSESQVFLLAASNLPWELDFAMLRRLEKRILIHVPDFEARKFMFQNWLPFGNQVASLDYSELSKMTEGYTGSDIRLVCRESAMIPLRKIIDSLDLGTNVEPLIDTVKMSDVLSSIKNTRATTDVLLGAKYKEWSSSFGSE